MKHETYSAQNELERCATRAAARDLIMNLPLLHEEAKKYARRVGLGWDNRPEPYALYTETIRVVESVVQGEFPAYAGNVTSPYQATMRGWSTGDPAARAGSSVGESYHRDSYDLRVQGDEALTRVAIAHYIAARAGDLILAVVSGYTLSGSVTI